jgi:hypothetical protein
MALAQVFVRIVWFSPVDIIPPSLSMLMSFREWTVAGRSSETVSTHRHEQLSSNGLEGSTSLISNPDKTLNQFNPVNTWYKLPRYVVPPLVP